MWISSPELCCEVGKKDIDRAVLITGACWAVFQTTQKVFDVVTICRNGLWCAFRNVEHEKRGIHYIVYIHTGTFYFLWVEEYMLQVHLYDLQWIGHLSITHCTSADSFKLLQQILDLLQFIDPFLCWLRDECFYLLQTSVHVTTTM